MTVYTEVRGQGPDLVLLHGWGLSGAAWSVVVKQLEQSFRLTLVDLPGHGRSPWDDTKAYTIEKVAAQVRAVTPKNAAWLGWSMGGLIAMHIALQQQAHQPQPVKQLLLLACNAQFVRTEQWLHAMDGNVLSQFASGLEQDYKTTLNRFLSIQAMGGEHAKQTVRELKKNMEHHGVPSLVALRGGLALLRELSFVEVLADLHIPTLLMFGHLDTLVPARVAEDMQSRMPQADVHIFEHASHAPFISHVDEFVSVVKAFIK